MVVVSFGGCAFYLLTLLWSGDGGVAFVLGEGGGCAAIVVGEGGGCAAIVVGEEEGALRLVVAGGWVALHRGGGGGVGPRPRSPPWGCAGLALCSRQCVLTASLPFDCHSSLPSYRPDP